MSILKIEARYDMAFKAMDQGGTTLDAKVSTL